MKELKMSFFPPRTIYSIMNSNRHENINIISEKPFPLVVFYPPTSRPITK